MFQEKKSPEKQHQENIQYLNSRVQQIQDEDIKREYEDCIELCKRSFEMINAPQSFVEDSTSSDLASEKQALNELLKVEAVLKLVPTMDTKEAQNKKLEEFKQRITPIIETQYQKCGDELSYLLSPEDYQLPAEAQFKRLSRPTTSCCTSYCAIL